MFTLTKFKEWWAKRIERAKEDAFQRGYDWMAGRLLKGVDPQALELELDSYQGYCGNESSSVREFDRGSYQAIYQWNTKIAPHLNLQE